MPLFMVVLTACPKWGRKECGDPNAANYNPRVDIEDSGVCIYEGPQVVFDIQETDPYHVGDTLKIKFSTDYHKHISTLRIDLVDYLTGDMFFDSTVTIGQEHLDFESYLVNKTRQYRELGFKITMIDLDGQQFNYTHGKYRFYP